MVEAVIDEELTGDALADQAPLHVADRGDDRVDLVRGDERGQLVDTLILPAAAFRPSLTLSSASPGVARADRV